MTTRILSDPIVIYRACYAASEWIRFNEVEFRSAAQAGTFIWRKSQQDGRTDRDRGFPITPEQGKRNQALGSLCERVAAKCLGVYWPCVFNNFRGADLPHNVEVRLIGNEAWGLRVYPTTPDSRRVIGVVIPPGMERGSPRGSFRYRVAGWIIAEDAKREHWRLAPHGGSAFYAVPQDQLRHPRELRRLIAADWRQASGSVG